MPAWLLILMVTNDSVASSVVPLVLKYPKAGDIFLFTNILMTDLQTLKKRGFNGKIDSLPFKHPLWLTLFCS
jgi:hypothetical protein